MVTTKRKLTRKQFVERLKKIKLLALDVDGVLTDDSIYFGPDGFEMKRFNISDGFFVVLGMRAGLEIAIVSGRNSSATDSRTKDLGIKHVLQGKRDKVAMIEPLLTEMNIKFADVAFAGNELLDIALAEKVGVAIAVPSSVRELLEVAHYVTHHDGGHGAVREIIECYFEAQGKNPREFIK